MTPEFTLDLLTEYCSYVKFSEVLAKADDFYKGFNTAIDIVLNQIEIIRNEIKS